MTMEIYKSEKYKTKCVSYFPELKCSIEKMQTVTRESRDEVKGLKMKMTLKLFCFNKRCFYLYNTKSRGSEN